MAPVRIGGLVGCDNRLRSLAGVNSQLSLALDILRFGDPGDYTWGCLKSQIGALGTVTVEMPEQDPHAAVQGYAQRYQATEEILGTVGMAKRPVGPEESSLASKLWWDADASAYLREHGEFLGDVEFKWCPEGLTEAQAGLLGPLDGKSIIEIGCGAAACARWLATQGARVVGADISGSMLQHAAATSVRTSVHVDYVQADVQRLPFAADSFDLGCSAFGALPFIPDPTAALREIHRILKPGARWVFAINHPITWIFPDDPGVAV